MTQEEEEYDVVVIGSGPGGYVAALRAAQLGLKTACIEKDKSFGGTCLNVGCIPSKALLQSSEHLAWIQHDSQQHGIQCDKVSFDFSKMMQRKNEVVQGLTQGVAWLFKNAHVTPFTGIARLLDPHHIEVKNSSETQTLTAKNIILATGSEAISLPFLPFDEKRIVSSTGALRLPSVPKTLLIIGGGIIGVEIASVYNRLGSKVIVVEMLDHIGAGLDRMLSKALLQTLQKQGITFHLGAKVTKAESQGQETLLTIEQGETTFTLKGDVVLVAVGRRGYTEGLGLESVNIASKRGIVEVDQNFRTAHPHIYAIGDIIEGPMLAHRASEEGYAVAELIAGMKPQLNYMAIPNVVYTHPEVASLGMTEEEARALGIPLTIGVSQFRGNPRARCNGYTEGLVKVMGTGPNGTLIGLHIIGPQASELINAGLVAIEKHTTLRELAVSPTAHPTLSEAIKDACLEAKAVS